MSVVLLVDDDSEALLSLARALKGALPEVTFHGAGTIKKALEIQETAQPRAAVIDLSLETSRGVASGFELLETLRKNDPALRVIVLTGHGSTEHGVTSIQKGAASFLEKPANIQHLAVLLSDAINQSMLRRELEARLLDAHRSVLSHIAGVGEKARKLKDEILFAAFSNQPIFLNGESGTGKGLCAAVIHSLGRQKEGRFIRYQPSFMSSDLVNSDLFGHKKGAFTGAESDRKGLIEEASSGTLFLDEIDSLPLETQVLLLGVLQERLFRPVGSNQTVQSNFRLISASNSHLTKLIDEGKFRKDLYFRIAHLTIEIPPLRERKEDLEVLVESILSELRERGEISVCEVHKDAMVLLQSYDWPGNIRELQAVVEGAAYRAQFESRYEIKSSDIKLQKNHAPSDSGGLEGFHAQVAAFKLKLIQEALDRNGGNQVRAAKELGLDRSTMRRLMSGS